MKKVIDNLSSVNMNAPLGIVHHILIFFGKNGRDFQFSDIIFINI
jgi:hypothetical protein